MRLDRILYDAAGHQIPPAIYYVRWVKKASGLIWDDVNKELMPNPDLEDSAILLEETGLTGSFPVWVPREIPPGVYDVICYKQGGSVPQNTDNIERQWDTSSPGSILGF